MHHKEMLISVAHLELIFFNVPQETLILVAHFNGVTVFSERQPDCGEPADEEIAQRECLRASPFT